MAKGGWLGSNKPGVLSKAADRGKTSSRVGKASKALLRPSRFVFGGRFVLGRSQQCEECVIGSQSGPQRWLGGDFRHSGKSGAWLGQLCRRRPLRQGIVTLLNSLACAVLIPQTDFLLSTHLVNCSNQSVNLDHSRSSPSSRSWLWNGLVRPEDVY